MLIVWKLIHIKNKVMKVLSIEQMTRLKELGVDVTPKEECLIYSSVCSDDYKLMCGQSVCEDDVVAFGLQDVIELLPKVIIKEGLYLHLNISITYSKWYCFEYSFCNGSQFNSFISRENILDAAYNMLIWVIENNYLKTMI